MSKLVPKYTIWEAIQAALSVGTKALEEVRDLARQPGPRGLDGLGFDDLEITYDGARQFAFKMSRGSEVKEFPFTVPVMIYRGVYREGETYAQGDTVTWGGHVWHCDTRTADKPDGVQKCWTMAMRRARDGKDAVVKALPEKPKG